MGEIAGNPSGNDARNNWEKMAKMESPPLMAELREIGHLHELDAVTFGDLGGVRGVVDVAEVDLFDPVGAERLHAGGAGHRGRGDQLGFAPTEQAAEVDLGVQHEFLPRGAVVPK